MLEGEKAINVPFAEKVDLDEFGAVHIVSCVAGCDRIPLGDHCLSGRSPFHKNMLYFLEAENVNV